MSEYTAEEYREVLKAIYDMDAEERKNDFGVSMSMLVGDYVKDFSVSALIEKYRAYYTPQTGEYWKRKKDGEMVVVRRIEENKVYVYYCDSSTTILTLKYFLDNYQKTEYKSKYLEAFLDEMKGWN